MRNYMTQGARILMELRKAGQRGVPNYRFPQMNILRYSARIGELREEGYKIEAERQYINGRWTGVWFYRLTSDIDPDKTVKCFELAPEPLATEPKVKNILRRFNGKNKQRTRN